MGSEGYNFNKASESNKLKPQKLTEINNPEHLKSNIESIRADLTRFDKNVKLIRINYPNVANKFPNLFMKYAEAKNIADKIYLKNLKGEQLKKSIEKYNLCVNVVNKFSDEMRGEILANSIPGKLLKEEEKEVNEFTKQMWQELFPETSVSKFVKKNSNKTELEDYQKILIAPGEGIEVALRGLASIVNPETYKEFGSAIATIRQIDKNNMRDMTRFLKQSYEELSNTDKVHHALVLIVSIIFIFGGYSKISNMIEGLKGSARVKNLMQSVVALKNTHYASSGANMTPMLAVTGMHLKYAKAIK